MSEIEKGGEIGSPQEATSSEKCCGIFIMVLSIIFIIVTFPFSLCACLKMVQVRDVDTANSQTLTDIFDWCTTYIKKRTIGTTYWLQNKFQMKLYPVLGWGLVGKR